MRTYFIFCEYFFFSCCVYVPKISSYDLLMCAVSYEYELCICLLNYYYFQIGKGQWKACKTEFEGRRRWIRIFQVFGKSNKNYICTEMKWFPFRCRLLIISIEDENDGRGTIKFIRLQLNFMWHILWTKDDWSVIWINSRTINCEVRTSGVQKLTNGWICDSCFVRLSFMFNETNLKSSIYLRIIAIIY